MSTSISFLVQNIYSSTFHDQCLFRSIFKALILHKLHKLPRISRTCGNPASDTSLSNIQIYPSTWWLQNTNQWIQQSVKRVYNSFLNVLFACYNWKDYFTVFVSFCPMDFKNTVFVSKVIQTVTAVQQCRNVHLVKTWRTSGQRRIANIKVYNTETLWVPVSYYCISGPMKCLMYFLFCLLFSCSNN